MQQHILPFGLAPWGPLEGQKVKYRYILITKAFSNIFKPNVVCLLTNKTGQDFHLVTWVMPQGWDFGGAWSKVYFSEHGHAVYQIEGDDEYIRTQENFLT